MTLVIRSSPVRALLRMAPLLAIAALLASCGPPEAPQDRAAPGALGQALAAEGTTAAVAPANNQPIPYVVIRFERPGIAFEDSLYSAMSRALDRYPAAQFDVVLAMPPLSPRADPQEAVRMGEQHIEDVVLAMTDMGLPSDRLRVAASTEDTADVDEIRIFVH